MQEYQLLYLMYGKKSEYLIEAKFSILSALRHRADSGSFDIAVMTDQPELFAGWPVRLLPIDESKLVEWTGTGGYVHRRKACAIREGLKYAEKTIFVDTDTVFTKDPALLFQRVDNNCYLMDQHEFTWKQATRRREYCGLVAQLESENASPRDALPLYNSGLCGMMYNETALMDRAIQQIDSWAHHHEQLHTMEQIAVSFVLDGKNVSEAKDCVHHYFSKKPFFHAMHKHFFRKYGLEFHPGLPELSFQVPVFLPKLSILEKAVQKIQLIGLSTEGKKVGRFYFLGKPDRGNEYESLCRAVWWQKALEHFSCLNPSQQVATKARLWAGDSQFQQLFDAQAAN